MPDPETSHTAGDIAQHWLSHGKITVKNAEVSLPTTIPDVPGLYRLKFNEEVFYVGETKSLMDRLGAYHTPGQGIESDHRIHRALVKFDGAMVEVMTEDEFIDQSLRKRRENVEIQALRDLGKRLLNGRPDCVENLLDRIEYHQSEIEKLEMKVKMLTKEASDAN